MQVYAITPVMNNNSNNKTQSFEKLIKDKSALQVINSMTESDKVEFKNVEKRLKKTKFWDLKIFGIGDKFKEFKFEFIEKSKKHCIITGGIYPYNRSQNTIDVYSIFYGPKNILSNTVEHLKFSSEERAQELYDAYRKNSEFMINCHGSIRPIEALRGKEIELNMLEEAFRTSRETESKIYSSAGKQTKNSIGTSIPKS